MSRREEPTRNRHIAGPIALLAWMLPAVVVALVLGIIGMHALNTHGVMSNADHTTMGMPVIESAVGSIAQANGHLDVASALPAAAPLGDTGHDMGDMGDMVMLCVAMLAAAAGALLLLLLSLRYRPRVWFHLPTNTVSLTEWFTTRPGTGPPPVWEFSVVRC